MGNENNTKIVLSTLRYKSSPIIDNMVDVGLSQTSKESVEFDRSNTIDLAQVYENERQASNTFRPVTKITYLFKNTYYGETNYPPFTENLYYINAITSSRQFCGDGNNDVYWSGYPLYNEFDLMRTDNNVVGYTKPGTTNHIDFVSTSASSYNWNFFISYPYDNINKTLKAVEPITNTTLNWTAFDGIPFIISNTTSNGQSLITFRSVCRHGLSVGEFAYLSINYNGQSLFQVYDLGDGSFASEEYVFSISNLGYTGNTFDTGTSGTFKRVIDENNYQDTMSEYYVRKHKIITNPEDAMLVNAGFELNPFKVVKQYEPSALTPNNISRISVKEGSQSYTLSFSKDISIDNLVDNQNRPLTQLFFTFQWVGVFGWTSRPTYPSVNPYIALKEGFDFNLPLNNGKPSDWWDNDPQNLTPNAYTSIPTISYTKPSGSTTITFYYNKPLNNGDTLDGDFCEWNDYEYTERVISDAYHKIIYNDEHFDINITDQAPALNPLGYYYKPHNPIKIRDFSSYIEEGDPATVSEIPDYAVFSKTNGTFIWRDIYTYGFVDTDGIGVDYPFLNGVHYPFTNTIFRVIPEGASTPLSTIKTVALPTTDECE
jgi:hypothetical protein